MTDTPGIGHNSTAFEAFGMALDDAYTTAKDFLDGQPIETQGQADAVGRIVGEVKRIKKDADEARKEEKRPHDEAAKAVQTKWAPLLDRADTILTTAQKPLTAYLTKLAEEQAERERLALQEAERAAQAAREARGDGIEAVENAKVLDTLAEHAAKDARRAGKQKAHVAGMDRAIGLRTYRVATVTDYPALLRHIKETAPGALRAWMDDYATKALPSQLPGVTVTTEKRVA